MKVLNLHCASGHAFEGWFANEADFQSQHARGFLSCPVCDSPEVRKGLSAPRLNLSGAQRMQPCESEGAPPSAPPPQANAVARPAEGMPNELVQTWLELSRRIVAGTEDVGERFAQEARKMHYGEIEDRAIRGQATPTEVSDLLEEGIDVVPLALPAASKHTLQ